MSLLIDLRTGRFDIVISGGMTRYLIPGLGIVDVKSDLHVVPGDKGKARVLGKAEAWVRRLDNSFFRDLTGSLPRLTTDLERTTDGVLHFSNLQLYSRDLRLSGSGIRRRDGTFHIEARGRQAKYGPLRMVLDGRIERPKIDLLLDSPNEAMGIRAMRLSLDPTAAGFDYRASGGSKLGPFTSQGPDPAAQGRAGDHLHRRAERRRDDGPRRPAVRSGRVHRHAGAGRRRHRRHFGLRAGRMARSGSRRISTASNAKIPGDTAIAIRSGKLDGTILLEEGRTSLDGTLVARGLAYGAIDIARLTASGRLVNGSGQVRAAIAGRRGQAFELVGAGQCHARTASA